MNAEEMRRCRHAFEHYVSDATKSGDESKYMEVDSQHWTDFKAGWMARSEQDNQHQQEQQ